MLAGSVPFYQRRDSAVRASSLSATGEVLGDGFFVGADSSPDNVVGEYVGNLVWDDGNHLWDRYTMRVTDHVLLKCEDFLYQSRPSHCQAVEGKLDPRTQLPASCNAEVVINWDQFRNPRLLLYSTKRNGKDGEYAVQTADQYVFSKTKTGRLPRNVSKTAEGKHGNNI
ncbi:hypothetical protein B484DRAFT_466926 [Ochromonadaceae sp. CCMP2298]|nr:hypothetical protein B484DRAFT_466926 [Ochromonadaceae sp. CCMP2298]